MNVLVPNTYTAGDEGKVVSNGALVAQSSQSIDTNGTYDTTLKNEVVVNVSGGGGSTNLVVGAIRPDAELWKTYTYDKNVIDDEVIASIPAYSTSSQTLVAGATIDSVTLDYDNYDYVVSTEILVIPKYNNKGGAGIDYMQSVNFAEIAEWGTTLKGLDGSNLGVTGTADSKSNNASVQIYSSPGETAKVTMSASYGIISSMSTGHTLSNDRLTIRNPSLTMRGSTTQMTQSAWETLTDIRWQYIIKVYRAPKGNLNINGFNLVSMINYVQQCVANGGTLT